MPETLPTGQLNASKATTPVYTETATCPGSGTGLFSSDLPGTRSNSARNQLAETRAVDLSHQALTAQGWTRTKDCQNDGVGYDLLYSKGQSDLHVEVKGIMSTTLAFNLTPKEDWRVEIDPVFVVMAVTNVLSPTAFKLHLITRDRLAVAPRDITGFRLKL